MMAFRHRVPLYLMAFALTACGDSTSPDGEDELTVVTAPAAVGVPGWELIDTIRIEVRGDDDEPRPGVEVAWSVTAGGGSVEALAGVTDDDGVAAAVWTLGPAAGPNELLVTAGELDATFEVTGAVFQTDHVTAGFQIGCGLVDGAVWCWGSDSWATTAPASNVEIFGVESSAPGLVDDSRDYVELAVGLGTVCARAGDGVPWCATSSGPDAPLLAPLAGAPALSSIAADGWGEAFCGIAELDGTAWCWDANTSGPVLDSPAFTMIAIDGPSAGSSGSLGCGLLADATAACWGDAPLGDGTSDASASPVAVAGGHEFAEIVTGDGFACGRKAAGEVWCWGRDYDAAPTAVAPITVPTLATTGATGLAAGAHYALALTEAGLVRWHGAGFEELPAPTGLPDAPIIELASGTGACVRLADGRTHCLAEMFDNSSVVRLDEFIAVQPLR